MYNRDRNVKGDKNIIMKSLKKQISVLTFILAIVATIISFDGTSYAAPAEISGEADQTDKSTENIKEDTVSDSHKESHKYDQDFKNAKLSKVPPRATGLQVRLSLSDIKLSNKKYKVKWTSSNAKIAQVRGDGQVTTKKAGKAVITASVLCDNEAVYTYKTTITVTNPHFSNANIGMQVGNTMRLKVYGASSSKHTLHISNHKVVSSGFHDKLKVKAQKHGKVTVWTWADGKKIYCSVYVTNPSLTTTDYFVTKGSSEKIRIKNWSGKTTPTFQSSNRSVATVGKDGRIYGKKAGSCRITVYVENKKLSCYVAVGNKTVTNTLKSAYRGLGCRYSQSRRMSKNYYDCSSFVWRNYSKHGVNFGDKKYAPTASYQAINMVKRKKQVSYRYMDSSKLLPGDVIFVQGHSKSGRYRNINHVVLYMGNGRIIHATPPKVKIGTYHHYSKRIAVIARPTK